MGNLCDTQAECGYSCAAGNHPLCTCDNPQPTGDCLPCQANYYCDGSNNYACPTGTTSPEFSTSLSACVGSPTIQPIGPPTFIPSYLPTITPTIVPSWLPTTEPTIVPSWIPTTGPTVVPSTGPTVVPTTGPSIVPTTGPTVVPTTGPTVVPTQQPTTMPSWLPTQLPSLAPSHQPTRKATLKPTTTTSILSNTSSGAFISIVTVIPVLLCVLCALTYFFFRVYKKQVNKEGVEMKHWIEDNKGEISLYGKDYSGGDDLDVAAMDNPLTQPQGSTK